MSDPSRRRGAPQNRRAGNRGRRRLRGWALAAAMLPGWAAAAPAGTQDYLSSADAAVRQQVSDGLDWDKQLAPYDIQVRVHDRLVRLSGVVGSSAERRRALRIAERGGGVIGVVNGLRVQPGAAAAPGKQPAAPDDRQLQARIKQTLAAQPDVDVGGIAVSVHDGQVVLSGTVPEGTQRQLAKRVALSLYGVRGVTDRLKVGSAPAKAPYRRR